MVVLFEVPDGQTSSTDAHRYDVFLSFRGLDTRYSFTNHLHKALIDANITTFLDDEEIETGEDLKPELENAIKASRASVIVLSKNYATSTWCLDELVLILEQRITFNQIVIPIFYHVEPTHVRWQEGSFGDAMAKHKRKMDAETDANKRCQWAQKMDRWNKALFKVANLKGNDVKGRLETEFIDEIVKDIYRRLRVPLRSAQPLLIGMDHYINFVTSWLKNGSAHRTDILTILGMGGIGKTSLAKYVYELHCRDREFDTSSYIKDVSRTCDGKFNGLLCLQKQFCDDILKTSPNQVHDVLTYTSMIENAVAHKKVFLVLDDIDSIDQLDALLGSKGFHPGSKIIITTKDTWVTENCALLKKNINMKHEKLLLQGLDEDESLELLCFHAFMSSNPKEGYEEVSDKLVKYCQGHPLALEVLGKSLHNRDVAYWEGCIEGLMKETYPRINNVLKMSFNSLPSNNDKELFKHIACFFVGMDRDVTETILEACGINTRTGMTNLIEKFFVRIDCDNKLMMHQLLQEMGKSEVCQESPLKPWKRSRIWCNEESFRVLKQNKGNENLVGLALDMRMLGKEKLRVTCLKTDALMNMDNLKLLQLNYVQMDGSYKNFPEEIRWLCMHGFLLKSIPSDLPMENLVALDLSCSNIESFAGCHSDPQRLEKRQRLDGSCLKDKRLLGSLKILNLSFCNQLRTLCDFEQLPALEKLIVTHCVSLVEVCESIGQCIELVFIDMSYCKKLEKLPRNIGMLKKVRTLLLDGCNLGESQSMNIDMDSLVMYKANNNIGINTRASSSAFVGDISRDLKYFASYLPSSVVRLSLAYNNLSTESFPVDFSCLFMLKELSLDENPIVSMPHCVRTLPRLERLSMVKCENLKSVEHPPHTLKELSLYSLIEKVVFDPEMSPLELSLNSVEILHCSHEIQGVIKIQPIVTVEEKVLRSLDWTNLDLFNRRVGTSSSESEIQMIYEFGIFSTIYEDEEMPSRFLHRSAGPSISFTIPSSPNNIRGLNLCSVQTLKPPAEWDLFLYGHVPRTPMMTISNITKNRMWIYERFKDRSTFVGGKCWVMLSHWMFGRNEMEAGDHVTITLTEPFNEVVKECGVSLVYEDGEEEEEDVLAYYKSWNHIIGGDLSHFQTTTGEYMLNNELFFLPWVWLHPYHRKFVPDGPKYQEKESAWFRALSPRKPDIV